MSKAAVVAAVVLLGGCADTQSWLDMKAEWLNTSSHTVVTPPRLSSAQGMPQGKGASKAGSVSGLQRSTCPGSTREAHDALAKPSPIPAENVPATPDAVKRWAAGYESQVRDLKTQLRSTLSALDRCAAGS